MANGGDDDYDDDENGINGGRKYKMKNGWR